MSGGDLVNAVYATPFLRRAACFHHCLSCDCQELGVKQGLDFAVFNSCSCKQCKGQRAILKLKYRVTSQNQNTSHRKRAVRGQAKSERRESTIKLLIARSGTYPGHSLCVKTAWSA
eukprot:6212947-Pleurochrysis_carterae.AAC.2